MKRHNEKGAVMKEKREEDLQVYTNADMSHQNTLRFKLSLLWDSIRLNGPKETLERMALRGYYRLKGVDFSTENLHNLTLTGPHTEHGTALVSTSRHFFRRILSELESFAGCRIGRELFVDYGSGKGAALIHARALGFRRAVGIEFARELNDTALENIRRLGIDNITSLYLDATQYTPPADTSVIYFFNPFDAIVMEKVMQNIVSADFTNKPWIIYGRPTCSDVVDRYATRIGESRHESGAVVYYYKL